MVVNRITTELAYFSFFSEFWGALLTPLPDLYFAQTTSSVLLLLEVNQR